MRLHSVRGGGAIRFAASVTISFSVSASSVSCVFSIPVMSISWRTAIAALSTVAGGWGTSTPVLYVCISLSQVLADINLTSSFASVSISASVAFSIIVVPSPVSVREVSPFPRISITIWRS